MIEIQLQEEIKKLKQKIIELENKNIEQSEFLSIIAHQLRGPLSGTKWIFKMLLDGDFGFFNPEHRAIIEKGYKNNERIIKLLQEILTANKNNVWEFEYNFQKVNLVDYLKEVIANFLEEARIKKIHISFKQLYNYLPEVLIDKNNFFFAIENLLENALKYNFENGEIIIKINYHNNYDENSYINMPMVLIEIYNSGPGIPILDQKNIFTKFYRATNVKEKIEGTGLGLFTVKKIIEKHNGKIWFQSAENQGTSFFIALPIPKNF